MACLCRSCAPGSERTAGVRAGHCTTSLPSTHSRHPYFPLLSDDFRDLLTQPHHLQQGLTRQSLDGLVPTHQGLHEFQLPRDALAYLGRGLRILPELRCALAQKGECRIELAAFATLHDHADDLPGI